MKRFLQTVNNTHVVMTRQSTYSTAATVEWYASQRISRRVSNRLCARVETKTILDDRTRIFSLLLSSFTFHLTNRSRHERIPSAAVAR